MRHDGRLSRVLHVLIHMDRHDRAMTSEAIAAMLGANPVVIRRTMSGLRDKGYVCSEKGRGGGWRLSRSLSDLTLLDVYRALGDPPLFAIGLSEDNPACLVERAVNQALEGALAEAEQLLLKRFGDVTLADIGVSFDEAFGKPGQQVPRQGSHCA